MTGMRILSGITLAIAAAAFSACGQRSTEPTIAVIASPGGVSNSVALTISPNQITLSAGSTAQLSTNAGTQSSQLQWSSSNTPVATVNGSGLIHAFQAGSATITARFSSDTARSASATVIVTP
jgi:uncharacterized protein YjdB